MNTLIRHIEYLVSRTDCVVVPRVGAFLASNVNACYNSDNHTVAPPCRMLAFNGALNHNDGVLLASIQRAEGLGYDAAQRKLTAGIDALLALIDAQGYARIGSVGTLQRDSLSQSMVFTPDADSPYVSDMLWLETLQLDPVERDNVVAAPIVKHTYSRGGRLARIAASIAVLFALGFVLSTPLPIDDSMLASLAPELSQTPVDQLLPEPQAAPVLTVALPAPADDSVFEACRPASMSVEPDGRFYVVVASLASADEAHQWITACHDADLRLYDHGPYHRVYASSHDTAMAAYQAAMQASSRYPGAWVCRK